MKKIFFLFAISLSCFSVNAQEWLTNFEEAQQKATDENKKIVLVFSGSDWCAPCIRLEEEVFNTEDFKNYAKDNYVLVKADFPKRKANKLAPELEAHNKELIQKYNPNGYFPFVALLESTGSVIGETGYIRAHPLDYIKHLNAL